MLVPLLATGFPLLTEEEDEVVGMDLLVVVVVEVVVAPGFLIPVAAGLEEVAAGV